MNKPRVTSTQAVITETLAMGISVFDLAIAWLLRSFPFGIEYIREFSFWQGAAAFSRCVSISF
jgi:hypothetical protein